MKYNIIVGTSYVDLARRVNNVIKEGWLIYGNISVNDGFVAQVVVKKDSHTGFVSHP